MYKNFCVLICIFLISISCRVYGKEADTISGNFKIYEIIELEKFYLILAVKNDNVYRVLSKKDINTTKCDSTLQLDKYFRLDLKEIVTQTFGALENYYCNCTEKKLAFRYEIGNDYVTLPAQHDARVYLALNISGKCLTQ